MSPELWHIQSFSPLNVSRIVARSNFSPLNISGAAVRLHYANSEIVQVFAAGVNVLSSWIGSTTATNTISGTRMATPHVAGLVAYLIALEGLSSPAAVQSRIKSLATSGKIVDAESANNLIGYNGNGA